jgi:predicted negative regulator of RcsB-dependent stress response
MLVSCAVSVSDAAFLKHLDEIDAHIVSGSAKPALKILNKLNRGSYSVQQRLGLYKRYAQLGEFARAETCLKNGLKDIPGNRELTAVYAWHLLERGKLGAASSLAEKLVGTRFGSIAAEIGIRQDKSGAARALPEVDRAFLPLFVDAYKTTQNDAWLINAAALYALDGDIAAAAALAPGVATSARQAMFWGELLLDVDYPREASDYFEAADRVFSYMDPYETDTSGREFLDLLKADAFVRQGDVRQAAEIWEAQAARLQAREESDSRPEDAVVFYNLAQKAKAEKNYAAWYANLAECLNRAPAELYALLAYADFALSQPSGASDDGFTDALRRSGLSSRGMSALGEIPRVPGEDVAARFNAALTQGPEYYAAYLRFLLAARESGIPLAGKDFSPLKNKAEVSLSKDAWLWDALEENYDSKTGYPAGLARFAFTQLLARRKYEDAERVFGLYFSKRYGFEPASAQTAGLIPRLAPWEAEAVAWLSLKKDPQLALKLYEYLYNKEIDETYPYAALNSSYEPSFEVIVNLAEIYIAQGKKERAEALYLQALSLEPDSQRKAELLYRLADLQSAGGNTRQALLNLDYCIVLDPEHRAARILQRKLKG